ncbi:hypothetical protein EVAR_103978_1 [Eumeta japonica]|uniref:Uncharacterized protein n=1 Tax=Eumeta variegata TaxID=151549 RepID=A0A4C1XWP4_EUMVA|nr:hypothetical protein EVAR_103978_1 [Eumeta japonica]
MLVSVSEVVTYTQRHEANGFILTRVKNSPVNRPWLDSSPVTSFLPYDCQPVTASSDDVQMLCSAWDRPRPSGAPIERVPPHPPPAPELPFCIPNEFDSPEILLRRGHKASVARAADDSITTSNRITLHSGQSVRASCRRGRRARRLLCYTNENI